MSITKNTTPTPLFAMSKAHLKREAFAQCFTRVEGFGDESKLKDECIDQG